MNWSDVGNWLKSNAGAGASLVGSLLTGNVPGAVAAGISLVSGATGHATPEAALNAFQSDPATLIRLKELAVQDEQNIRENIRLTMEAELKDKQAEHEQTQLTIRSGDNSEDALVRRTRPIQSSVSLIAAIAYAFVTNPPDATILGLLLTLPFAYFGLRQVGKGISIMATRGQK